jgi:16S rRNA (cytosine1402-N4)-methyltransferase
MTDTNSLHTSVLTQEVIEGLNIKPGKTYIDATFGLGGHARAILESEPTCKVIAIDLDKKSLDMVAPKFQEEFGERFRPLWGNFSSLYLMMKKHKIEPVAGILADLGTSQYQIFHRDGFSFTKETPLDMRMSNAHGQETAADIVNTFSEKDLSKLIFDYGQENSARAIAKKIVLEREHKAIVTTLQLSKIIESVIPRKPWEKKKHPSTKTFQALRIVVNKEIDSINKFLPAAFNALGTGGRLACISFHSLEDRPIKRFFVEKSQLGFAQILTKKPITPSEGELESNPSSRSAKLRIIERKIV